MAAHIYSMTCDCPDCRPSSKAAFDNFQPVRTPVQGRAERQFLSAIAGPLRKLKRQTWVLLTGGTPEKSLRAKAPWTAFEGLLLDRYVNEYLVAELGRVNPDPETWHSEGGLLPSQLATHFDTGVAVGVDVAQATVAQLTELTRERNKREFLRTAFARLSDRGWGCLKEVMDRPGSPDWYGKGHPGQAPGVRQIIEHGMGIGQNPVQTAREASAAYDNYERWEFSRLSRTETMFALNAGAEAELMAAGFTRVADETGALLGMPPFHPSCRCSVTIDTNTRQMVYSISVLACYICQGMKQQEALVLAAPATNPDIVGAPEQDVGGVYLGTPPQA